MAQKIALLSAAMAHSYVQEGPFTCNIWSKGMGREACHDNEPGAGGGGAGGNEPAKLSLTQAELDQMIGKRLGEERKKFADYDDLKKKVGELGTLSEELNKLKEEKELEGKTQAEKERIAGEKAKAAIERERAEFGTKLTVAEKRAAEAEAKYRNHLISGELGTGLDSAKVLPAARAKAVKLFAAEAKVELDEETGAVTSVIYGGISHKTVAEAAAAFLKDNEFLAAAQVGGGGGTRPPNSGGSGNQTQSTSTEGLLSAGFAARRK